MATAAATVRAYSGPASTREQLLSSEGQTPEESRRGLEESAGRIAGGSADSAGGSAGGSACCLDASCAEEQRGWGCRPQRPEMQRSRGAGKARSGMLQAA